MSDRDWKILKWVTFTIIFGFALRWSIGASQDFTFSSFVVYLIAGGLIAILVD